MVKIAWLPLYAHSLPEGHRFPMAKYDLIPEQLIYEGTITESQLFAPPPLAEEIVLQTHDADYWNKLKNLQLTKAEVRRTGFPHNANLIHRELCIMNGTLLACDYAFVHGIALNVAGGTHHAHTNKGEGFCLLNDIAIAANHLLQTNKANKILVVDLDVHQGNGTAQIFAYEPRVFTFSMHGEKNYPMHKEQSSLDVELPDGTGDIPYIAALIEHLPALIDEVQPDFVFYQSGVDVLATDKLGRLALSREGCKLRDRFVLETCKTNNLPLVCSMGGGYSEKLTDIVEAHANTYRLAEEIFG